MIVNKNVRSVRRLLLFFMIVLFLSGLTAIPIEAELAFLLKIFSSPTQLHYWLEKVLSAYKNVNHDTPFLLYGYNWLAFAHFILAILFIGPYCDPNKEYLGDPIRAYRLCINFSACIYRRCSEGNTNRLAID
jgi:hypothetical protein